MISIQLNSTTQNLGITPSSISECNKVDEKIKFVVNYIFIALANAGQAIWDLGKRTISLFSSEPKEEVKKFFRTPEESNNDVLKSILEFLPTKDLASTAKVSKQWNSFVKPIIIEREEEERKEFLKNLKDDKNLYKSLRTRVQKQNKDFALRAVEICHAAYFELTEDLKNDPEILAAHDQSFEKAEKTYDPSIRNFKRIGSVIQRL